jgi:hypothetical protein
LLEKLKKEEALLGALSTCALFAAGGLQGEQSILRAVAMMVSLRSWTRRRLELKVHYQSLNK